MNRNKKAFLNKVYKIYYFHLKNIAHFYCFSYFAIFNLSHDPHSILGTRKK